MAPIAHYRYQSLGPQAKLATADENGSRSNRQQDQKRKQSGAMILIVRPGQLGSRQRYPLVLFLLEGASFAIERFACVSFRIAKSQRLVMVATLIYTPTSTQQPPGEGAQKYQGQAQHEAFGIARLDPQVFQHQLVASDDLATRGQILA